MTTTYVCRVGSEVLESVAAIRALVVIPEVVCPVCRERVTLTRSNHMRHTTRACRTVPAESQIHAGAKDILRARALAGDLPLVGGRIIPKTWATVVLEHVIPGTSDSLDVACLDTQGNIVLGIEVCETSPMTAQKVFTLYKLRIPWIEVAAQKAAHTGLIPVQRGG